MWNVDLGEATYFTDYSGKIRNFNFTNEIKYPNEKWSSNPLFSAIDIGAMQRFPFVSLYNSTIDSTVGVIYTYATPNVRRNMRLWLWELQPTYIEHQVDWTGSDSHTTAYWQKHQTMGLEWLFFIKSGPPDSPGNIFDYSRKLYNNATQISEKAPNEYWYASFVTGWGINGVKGNTPLLQTGHESEVRSIFIPFTQITSSKLKNRDMPEYWDIPIVWRLVSIEDWSDNYEEMYLSEWEMNVGDTGVINISDESPRNGKYSLKISTNASDNAMIRKHLSLGITPVNVSTWIMISDKGEDIFPITFQRFDSLSWIHKIIIGFFDANFSLDVYNGEWHLDQYDFTSDCLGKWEKITIIIKQDKFSIFVNDTIYVGTYSNINIKDLHYFYIGISNSNATIYVDDITVTNIARELDDPRISGSFGNQVTSEQMTGRYSWDIDKWKINEHIRAFKNRDELQFFGNVTFLEDSEAYKIFFDLELRNIGMFSQNSLTEYDLRWKDPLYGWVGLIIKLNEGTAIKLKDKIRIILLNNTKRELYRSGYSVSYNFTVFGSCYDWNSTSNVYSDPQLTYLTIWKYLFFGD